MQLLAPRLWLAVFSLQLHAQCIVALLGRISLPIRTTPVVQLSRIQIRRQSLTPLALNRIFCEREEVQPPLYPQDAQLSQPQPQEQSRMVHFPKADYRFEHIRDILKLKPGDNLKIGVIDVGCTDAAGIPPINEPVILFLLPSIYPFHPSSQYTLSTHPLNTPSQCTLPIHPLNTLSIHPVNTLYQSIYLSPSQRLFPWMKHRAYILR